MIWFSNFKIVIKSWSIWNFDYDKQLSVDNNFSQLHSMKLTWDLDRFANNGRFQSKFKWALIFMRLIFYYNVRIQEIITFF